MARRRKKNASLKIDDNTQVLQRIIPGVLLIGAAGLGIIFLFALDNGVLGDALARGLRKAFGLGSASLYLLMAVAGVTLMGGKKGEMFWRLSGLFLIWLGLEGILHLNASAGSSQAEIMELGRSGQGGGMLGAVLVDGSVGAIGAAGSYFIFAFLMAVGVLVAGRAAAVGAARSFYNVLRGQWQTAGTALRQRRAVTAGQAAEPKKAETKKKPVFEKQERPAARDAAAVKPFYQVVRAEEAAAKETPTGAGERSGEEFLPAEETAGREYEYVLPPLSLLERTPAPAGSGSEDLAGNVAMLEKTLQSFGIESKIVCVTQGPAITRYELQPAAGVKISRIAGLADDIAMNLSAASVRIEAPIPGKAVVGIEVPNKETGAVFFREMLEGAAFQQTPGKLTLALGKDIAGAHVLGDLTQMPHLLIAGAPGSGKSVCINSIIASILYKSRPEEVKLLLIDPKRVEMANYEGVPHLVAPVVVEADKAASALKWVVREMESRYELFAACGERNIAGYNAARAKERETANAAMENAATDGGGETALRPELPFIVTIIDELADLMMVTPADVEDAICRMAQMGRAAGVHLIVATQRPSVNVVTGLIKANVPSRIAFAVSSQVDSRTILDAGGAEKLLGKGDMLYRPLGRHKPVRVQGCFIADAEVNRLVDHVKSQAVPEYREILAEDAAGAKQDTEPGDQLFAEAAMIFIELNVASTSLLQRKLRIGYSRAARLVDLLEEKKVIGSYDGSKSRAVLMTAGQFEQIYGARNGG
ncbi:MAG: DNA translocase FtsK [Gracilibacteraceae bacterium]|nr:DNA translocase FtsK [Gracilibacteraceae bacterium]